MFPKLSFISQALAVPLPQSPKQSGLQVVHCFRTHFFLFCFAWLRQDFPIAPAGLALCRQAGLDLRDPRASSS